MPNTRTKQERELAKLLNGIAKKARSNGLLDLFEETAADLFTQEQREVEQLIAEKGPEGALLELDRLRAEVWMPRWEAAFRPLVAGALRTILRGVMRG